MLQGVSGDVRTPDRLVDGDNSNLDGHHTWLAPVLPGLVGHRGVVCLSQYGSSGGLGAR